MNEFVAALPMYDWPEVRVETDALWARVRDALRAQGIDAPEKLARTSADFPRQWSEQASDGAQEDPPHAGSRPVALDLHSLWRHPGLLFAQTCWGPMELGLANHVRVVGQPDYSAYEGGAGELYSSAILMRRSGEGMPAPDDGGARLPLERLRGQRLAYNGPDSMSGVIALTRDLEQAGASIDLFAERIETGAHRASAIAVAIGEADVCAVDCRSWDLIRRFEPAAVELDVVGWTARRKGLPYIASLSAPVYKLDPAALGAGAV